MSAPQLSSSDVKALREANSVAFRLQGGRAFMRAYARPRSLIREFTSAEERIFNQVDLSVFERYREIEASWSLEASSDQDSSARSAHSEEVAARHMIAGANYEPCWQTAARIMRPGHRVELMWRSEANSALRAAGLHCDTLRLRLSGSRTASTGSVFLIAQRIGSDGSDRMIHSRFAMAAS